MVVGIVGLGLIGGSFAKAYKEAGHTVYAHNRNKLILDFALLSEDVDAPLTKENISECDLVLLCVYPEATLSYMKEMGPYIGEKPIVIDCCGTKRIIVDDGMKIAKEFGFTYVGGHPMAGNQHSGYKYAREDLYRNAPMVLVPDEGYDIVLLSKVKELLKPAGFNQISVTTAEKHDEMIAFTSQLAHLVSNAYIKSPTAKTHKGFSAGSYKDMTRVAWLNPQMWTELFLENKDYLINEVSVLIDNLNQYKDALEKEDKEELERLLTEGKILKEEVDGVK